MIRIHKKPVQFREDGLLISANIEGRSIGWVRSCDNGDGSVLLGDILIKERVELRNGFLDRMIRRVAPDWGVVFPRKHGVGSELLARFIKACDSQGVREIYGNVSPEADRDQPFLKGWYERHGFTASPLDGRDECIPVLYKVIWTRPGGQVTTSQEM